MNQRKNNLFTQVPVPNVKKNLFDLSHEVKMSGKFGFLYPILCLDTLPGDRIRNTMNAMIRFAPMLAPILHRCDVTTHFFFVPIRILTDHWEDFITGGQDGTEAPVLPFLTPLGFAAATPYMEKGSLWDYMGLPVHAGAAPAGGWGTTPISVLPFRAAAKVWNDYYRDPNLDTEMELDTDLQGNVTAASITSGILDLGKYRRAFEKDYFTSALPWAQRGQQVLVPMSVLVDRAEYTSGAPFTGSGDIMHGGGPDFDLLLSDADGAPPPGGGQLNLYGENSEITINDFRRALAIQRWMEANARGGARYVEQIKGHFDETVPDYRLMRAEYLGGGKQPVSISEVLSTAGSTENDLGDMAGHGISVGRTNKFTYRCQEHGYVIGFLSVTMRTAYSQGISRMWTREDKFDHAWPELANIGEQEILSREVFYSFDSADMDDNDTLFGYIPRYSEYKFQNDRIAGDFRDNLGFWHLGRNFTARPTLDVAFTTIFDNGGGGGAADSQEENFRRIFAVQDGSDYLWMQLYHHLTAKRPLPYFGVPQII